MCASLPLCHIRWIRFASKYFIIRLSYNSEPVDCVNDDWSTCKCEYVDLHLCHSLYASNTILMIHIKLLSLLTCNSLDLYLSLFICVCYSTLSVCWSTLCVAAWCTTVSTWSSAGCHCFGRVHFHSRIVTVHFFLFLYLLITEFINLHLFYSSSSLWFPWWQRERERNETWTYGEVY